MKFKKAKGKAKAKQKAKAQSKSVTLEPVKAEPRVSGKLTPGSLPIRRPVAREKTTYTVT